MDDKEKQKQASIEIEAILHEIDKLYERAEAIADEANIAFSVDGPTYGMGGAYEPKGLRPPVDEWGNENDGWIASSQSC